MENVKYVFTEETVKVCDHTLHRIKAARDFSGAKTGELGGFIEKEENLSHHGNAWVCDNAQVYDNAQVRGNAWVRDNAQVCGDAKIQSGGDYFCVTGAGSHYRTTTFFKTSHCDIFVKCGCFEGTLSEFVEKVRETHAGTKYEQEYLAAVELVRIHFAIAD